MHHAFNMKRVGFLRRHVWLSRGFSRLQTKHALITNCAFDPRDLCELGQDGLLPQVRLCGMFEQHLVALIDS